MKALLTCQICLCGFILCASSLVQAADGELTLIHMGDIHGHLVPRPNMRESDPDAWRMVGGLAYVYDQIKKIRQQHKNTLLINTGDSIQGSAEALYSSGEIIVDILNEFKIDAFAPGNWDFVYGTARFIELFSGQQAQANWHGLAANLYYATLYEFPATPYADKAGTRVLPPYKIMHVDGIKIGIIGLTADRGPQAISSRVMDGFYLTPGEDELRDAIPLLREQEQVDLIILISERGLAGNLELVETFPGIDIVLSSDMHEETHQILQAKSGTLLVEEGQDGTMLGELNLVIKDKKIARYTWTAHRINTANNQADEKIAEKIAQHRTRYLKGDAFHPHVNPISGAVLRTPIDTIIGYTRIPLHRSNFSDAANMPAVIEGSSHDFLSDAFKVVCDADVGMMRGFRYGTHIAPGPIKLEDLYHFIPIGPQIACGLMSGDDLRWLIERGAQGSLTQWVGAWGGGWLIAFSGITYALDPANEFGLRASNIRINGERMDAEKMYSVAGYWYRDDPGKINRAPALEIRVIKDRVQGIVDATAVVASYLRRLPTHTVSPQLNRVRLRHPLPAPIGKNKEIQPLKGVLRPDY